MRGAGRPLGGLESGGQLAAPDGDVHHPGVVVPADRFGLVRHAAEGPLDDLALVRRDHRERVARVVGAEPRTSPDVGPHGLPPVEEVAQRRERIGVPQALFERRVEPLLEDLLGLVHRRGRGDGPLPPVVVAGAHRLCPGLASPLQRQVAAGNPAAHQTVGTSDRGVGVRLVQVAGVLDQYGDLLHAQAGDQRQAQDELAVHDLDPNVRGQRHLRPPAAGVSRQPVLQELLVLHGRREPRAGHLGRAREEAGDVVAQRDRRHEADRTDHPFARDARGHAQQDPEQAEGRAAEDRQCPHPVDPPSRGDQLPACHLGLQCLGRGSHGEHEP